MSGTYLSKIPVLVVALVIGIVLVTSAVVPLASDYSDVKTFKNEGYFSMNKYDDSADSVTITWDHTAPRAINVGDDTYTLNTPVNQWIDLVVGDDWYIRYAYGGSVSFMGFDGSGFANQIMASVSNNSDMTAVLSEGTVTVTVTTTGASDLVKSTSYTEYYMISGNTGDYVMKKSDTSAYMTGSTLIYAIGATGDIFGGSVIYKLNGTITDGITITPIKVGDGITASNATLTTEEVAGYLDFYKLSTISFNVTKEDQSSTITYSYYIVPSEVNADNDNPAAYKNLIKVVPLMAFIMLVVAAAGMVYLKNKD